MCVAAGIVEGPERRYGKAWITWLLLVNARGIPIAHQSWSSGRGSSKEATRYVLHGAWHRCAQILGGVKTVSLWEPCRLAVDVVAGAARSTSGLVEAV